MKERAEKKKVKKRKLRQEGLAGKACDSKESLSLSPLLPFP